MTKEKTLIILLLTSVFLIFVSALVLYAALRDNSTFLQANQCTGNIKATKNIKSIDINEDGYIDGVFAGWYGPSYIRLGSKEIFKDNINQEKINEIVKKVGHLRSYENIVILPTRHEDNILDVGYINNNDHLDIICGNSYDDYVIIIYDIVNIIENEHPFNKYKNPNVPYPDIARQYVKPNRNIQVLFAENPDTVLIEDLDNDGYTDIVISKRFKKKGRKTRLGTYIYFGAIQGINSKGAINIESIEKYIKRTDNIQFLPGNEGEGFAVADLNLDGYKDIVIYSMNTGSDLIIYYGGIKGYNPKEISDVMEIRSFRKYDDNYKIQALNANNPENIVITDINNDGHPDIILSGWGKGVLPVVNKYISMIYYGSKNGFIDILSNPINISYKPGSSSQILPVGRSTCVRVADLDSNGFKDLIFASNFDEGNYSYSYIFYNSDRGINPAGITTVRQLRSFVFPQNSVQALPTFIAGYLDIADLNHDGYLDIYFANFYREKNKDVKVRHPGSGKRGVFNDLNGERAFNHDVIYFGGSSGYNPMRIKDVAGLLEFKRKGIEQQKKAGILILNSPTTYNIKLSLN